MAKDNNESRIPGVNSFFVPFFNNRFGEQQCSRICIFRFTLFFEMTYQKLIKVKQKFITHSSKLPGF